MLQFKFCQHFLYRLCVIMFKYDTTFERAQSMATKNKSFWGRYDIRAIVGEAFGAAQYQAVGQAFARYLKQRLPQGQAPVWVAVGFDARLHSPNFTEALIQGLTQAGINVVNLGFSTSPIVYFSEYLHATNPQFPDVAATLVVTASHNPSEYNGLKFTFQKGSLSEPEFLYLQELYHQGLEQSETGAEKSGEVIQYNILPEYIQWFEDTFKQVGQGIRVVIDSGNATAGIVAPEVFRCLGCEVIDIFTEPDGRFPNHHPDPCVHKNLLFLIDKVKETQADFGIAFDGDSDRLGVVDNQGKIIPGDQITMFLAKDVLKEQPGATILFDIKGTQTLIDYIEQFQGDPVFAPSGHAFMKRTMKEQDISLGGELSGHIFFRDKHWGFDDALYAGCRFLESFAQRRAEQATFKLSDFVAELPQTQISEEIRVPCSREQTQQLIDTLMAALKENPSYFGSPVLDVLTIDGLRINIQNGFFLLRASNTEPCITLRFEAPSAEIYQHIEQLLAELCSSLNKQSALQHA